MGRILMRASLLKIEIKLIVVSSNTFCLYVN